MPNQWFNVDRDGLRKLIERRGKAFLLFELLQNAWDEPGVTKVELTLERVPNSPMVRLCVEDDAPNGFADLTHAFTLFADSAKKDNAEQRGRFNLGEKLVLAMCERAVIASTRGTVVFDSDGRRTRREQRLAGSRFEGWLRMSVADRVECLEACDRLIPPIATWINGKQLLHRAPDVTFEATLPTEIGDADGVLRRTQRKTTVQVYRNPNGWLYELGIPVVEAACGFDVNVGQKVPLNFDRDNVTPSYAKLLDALVLEHAIHLLPKDAVRDGWVTQAMESNADELSDATLETIATSRFGERRVSYDPSDPEANARATAAGYTVVHGGSLSAGAWDAFRRADVIRPAGQVLPTPKPYSDDPNAPPVEVIPPTKWTPGMARTAAYTVWLGQELLGRQVNVRFVRSMNAGACYGGGELDFNVTRLGKAWFAGPLETITDLLLHEFGHEYESNHLSDDFYRILTRLGAKAVTVALKYPERFAAYAVVDEFAETR